VVAAGVIGGGVALGAEHLLTNDANQGSRASKTTVISQPTSRTIITTRGRTINQLFRQDGPGVVLVTATSQVTSQQPFGFGPQQGTQTSQGTAFVIDRKGNLLTNEHVIDGSSNVTVTFSDGTKASAKVAGVDRGSDLAVLHVNVPASKLQPLPLGSSAGIQVGDGVVAIGNPFGYVRSVTAGIVSAVGRTIQAPNNFTITNAIQTDAAINHGNSGGPLLNLAGKVIGITAQIADSGVNANVGVGFAVPIDAAKRILANLESGKTVANAWLGIAGTTVASSSGAGSGVEVTGVTSGGPADSAGVHGACTGGDVITAIDGKAVQTIEQLQVAIASHSPGDKVALTVTSANGSTHTVEVTLGSQPSSAPQSTGATCTGG
jgi:S1-C subfamily serine protease